MFYKKADLKNLTKHSLERNCDEVLFSVKSQPANLLKKNPISYFLITFARLFIILFCVKTLVNLVKAFI